MQHYLIDVIYEYLQPHESKPVHRGTVSVITTSRPIEGCDIYAYVNAYSFKGRQPGLNVLLLFEPISVLPGQYDPEIWKHFDYIFTHYDQVITAAPEKIKKVPLARLNFVVDFVLTEDLQERQAKYPLQNKKNAICMINGNKMSRVPGEGYSKRVEAALWFHLYSDIPFDVFGNPPFSLPNYKRTLTWEERIPMLAQYKFGLCFENIIDPKFSLGYVDKIFDCLETRTLPIYFGTPDIKKYIPEGCYIDFRKFMNYRKLNNYLISIDDQMYQDYINRIDQWVGQGGFRTYSIYTTYDKLAGLLSERNGTPAEDIFDGAMEWIPGLDPSLEGRSWKPVPDNPHWTFMGLSKAPSPLVDYSKNKQGPELTSTSSLEKTIKLEKKGNLAEASKAIEKFLFAGNLNAELLYRYSQILIAMKRYEESFEQLKRVLMLDQGHALALNDLAALYILKKDYKTAVQFLHAAINADRHNYPAIENLIDLLLNLGQKDYLIPFTQNLLVQSPKDIHLQELLRKYNLPSNLKILSLNGIKSPSFALSSNFLNEIASIFQAETFIETGTFLGETSLEASRVFKKVYTVELSEPLYLQAKDFLKNVKNVQLILGDSGKIFPELLKGMNGKIIFWLDGHYSEGFTARAEENSPILEELKAIKMSGITEAVILIDDLRMFPNSWTKLPELDSLTGYPKIPQLLQAIYDINFRYNIIVLGDILLVFPTGYSLSPTPFILSCTLSRLFDDGNDEDALLLEAEKNIGRANGEEMAMINNLYYSMNAPECAGLGEHFRLWKALSLIHQKEYAQACEILESLIVNGFTHWRIHWYLAQAAFYSQKTDLAENELKILLRNNPKFQEAENLRKDLRIH